MDKLIEEFSVGLFFYKPYFSLYWSFFLESMRETNSHLQLKRESLA